MRNRLLISLLWTISLSACVEPFNPKIENKEVGFLVVDGYINTTTHTALIKLSRAIPLTSNETFPPEENANVTIEELDGLSLQLLHKGNGQFQLQSDKFLTGHTYRLRVRTNSGKEYQSAAITPKSSPPIDSINWLPSQEGIDIRVSTHDDSKSSIYYRWDFTETWEYRAPYYSGLILKNGVLFPRSPNDRIDICYKSENAREIAITNTAGLTADRVSNFEITRIAKFSEKYSRHYSILVRQHVLTREAYDYWQQLKTSTETLGGLFDPQPSRVKGNISGVNNDETVIGYFDGGEVTEKRIFILFNDVPDYLKVFPRGDCEELEIASSRVSDLGSGYLITAPKVVNGFTVGYYYVVEACADCRKQGGVLQKPEFWP